MWFIMGAKVMLREIKVDGKDIYFRRENDSIWKQRHT